MLVVEIVLAAVVVFGVAAVAMGYGGSITHFAPDWPGTGLPTHRTVRANDIAAARFSLAVRGYRMSEVDSALDHLAGEIAQRDARIEELTGQPYESPVEPMPAEPMPAEPMPADTVAVEPMPADTVAVEPMPAERSSGPRQPPTGSDVGL